MPWEYSPNQDDSPRRREVRAHRTRVHDEVDRRNNISKHVYVRYHGLLPFCTNVPVPCGERKHWSTWKMRRRCRGTGGMPDHYAPLARRRLGEQVIDGYDR